MGFFSSIINTISGGASSFFNTVGGGIVTAANAVAKTTVNVANDAAKLATTAASEASKAANSVKAVAIDAGELAQKTTIIADEASELAKQSQDLATEAVNKAAEASRLADEAIRLSSERVARQAQALAEEAKNLAYRARDLGSLALRKARDASIEAALTVKHGTETALSKTLEALVDFLIDMGIISGCAPSDMAEKFVKQAHGLITSFEKAKLGIASLEATIEKYREGTIVVKNEKELYIIEVKNILAKHKELTDSLNELNGFKLEGMAIGPIPDPDNIGCIDRHRAADIVEYVKPFTAKFDIMGAELQLLNAKARAEIDININETKALEVLRENYEKINREVKILEEKVAYMTARNSTLAYNYRIANKGDCCVKSIALRSIPIADDGITVFDPAIEPSEYCGMYWGSTKACDIFYNNLCEDENNPRCACLPKVPLPTDSDNVAKIKNNMYCYNKNCNDSAYNQTTLDKEQKCSPLIITQKDISALEGISAKNVFVADEISKTLIFLVCILCALIYGMYFLGNIRTKQIG